MTICLLVCLIISLMFIATGMYMQYQCEVHTVAGMLPIINVAHLKKIERASAFVEQYGGVERIRRAVRTSYETFGPIALISLLGLLGKCIFWLF